MLYLKACPRCHGDMYLERDAYGQYKGCFQCGYLVDIDEPEVSSGISLQQEAGQVLDVELIAPRNTAIEIEIVY